MLSAPARGQLSGEIVAALQTTGKKADMYRLRIGVLREPGRSQHVRGYQQSRTRRCGPRVLG